MRYCDGMNRDGTYCSRITETGYCWQHTPRKNVKKKKPKHITGDTYSLVVDIKSPRAEHSRLMVASKQFLLGIEKVCKFKYSRGMENNIRILFETKDRNRAEAFLRGQFGESLQIIDNSRIQDKARNSKIKLKLYPKEDSESKKGLFDYKSDSSAKKLISYILLEYGFIHVSTSPTGRKHLELDAVSFLPQKSFDSFNTFRYIEEELLAIQDISSFEHFEINITNERIDLPKVVNKLDYQAAIDEDLETMGLDYFIGFIHLIGRQSKFDKSDEYYRSPLFGLEFTDEGQYNLRSGEKFNVNLDGFIDLIPKVLTPTELNDFLRPWTGSNFDIERKDTHYGAIIFYIFQRFLEDYINRTILLIDNEMKGEIERISREMKYDEDENDMDLIRSFIDKIGGNRDRAFAIKYEEPPKPLSGKPDYGEFVFGLKEGDLFLEMSESFVEEIHHYYGNAGMNLNHEGEENFPLTPTFICYLLFISGLSEKIKIGPPKAIINPKAAKFKAEKTGKIVMNLKYDYSFIGRKDLVNLRTDNLFNFLEDLASKYYSNKEIQDGKSKRFIPKEKRHLEFMKDQFPFLGLVNKAPTTDFFIKQIGFIKYMQEAGYKIEKIAAEYNASVNQIVNFIKFIEQIPKSPQETYSAETASLPLKEYYEIESLFNKYGPDLRDLLESGFSLKAISKDFGIPVNKLIQLIIEHPDYFENLN